MDYRGRYLGWYKDPILQFLAHKQGCGPGKPSLYPPLDQIALGLGVQHHQWAMDHILYMA